MRLRSPVLPLLAALAVVPVGAMTPPVVSASPAATFDLQAHRGGRGEHTEESLYGYAKSIELGVTTLELDIALTRDGVPLVWHDPDLQAAKCADTRPATPGDPQFPYVGKDIHTLSYKQVQTVVCSKKLPDFPDAYVVPNNRIATLPQLFALEKTYPGATVRYDIETKIEAEKRYRTAQPEQFVSAILGAARAADRLDRIEIESFDWRSLPLVKAQAPRVPTVALYDATTWRPGSRWLDGATYEKYSGDVVAAAKSIGAAVLSPDFALSDPALVRRAHAAGLKVLPWTVDDPGDIRAQVAAGVDGIITDYPTRARAVLSTLGKSVPAGAHR
ncbi:glycerophosphodiester phosphodiesterase family protein [Tsukamurella sp. 8F]|uniref:glycerophosphodiester phosphodiesterase family protein n=1 Tax=unclassified Tsukamurella TaxID=2633480 RepID=UPI0023B9FA34|nr:MULTISPECIES: glycerophosphodiester phosphodiesterase family protein [unclassified Tsukamurella]MDF0532059.1 glycerophosphodiester phosphodiesterase family protein [Tsukamurella sp. 8J]MDF0587510.1 glycerophosphodiester phosphodiesterase family protein [Tsukamurella sp. 8F]